MTAAILSVGDIALDYRSGADDGSTGGQSGGGTDRSLSGFVEAHAEFLLVFATMLVLAAAAHVGLRGTAYFYPTLIWGTFTLVVVTVAIDEVAGLDEPE